MKLIIDTDKKTLTREVGGGKQTLDLYSKKAFEILSDLWLKTGWSLKHIYTFTWLGRPVIQLPEDMLRVQEVVYSLKPDVIIETGIAHGGSLVFYASICHAMGRGRVIGVDIDIREHNRLAIVAHEMSPYITLIQGGSTDSVTVTRVKNMVQKGEKTLVILDSDHSKKHVLAELEAYHDLVSPGSYIVATDGILRDLRDVPRGYEYWQNGNPTEAVAEFLQSHGDFILETPRWLFNESELSESITLWPDAWLKRKEG